MWNTDPATHRSVRNPAFFGPVALAAALLTVSLFSVPLWQQFSWVEARAQNTTMLIGGYGACVRLRNDSVPGPTRWCSPSSTGYKLNVNLNDTFFTNFPTGTTDENILLGLQPQSDTIRTVEIVTGKSSLQILHILSSIAALLCVMSLIAPAKWFNKGKGGLANLQRSGIITLILAVVAFVLAVIAFVGILLNVLGAKNAMNSIEGIDAAWSGTCTMWFILPSAILYIPPFLVLLMPTYVRPEDQDEVESPMHPINPHQNSNVGFAKMNDLDSQPGTPYAGSLNKGQGGFMQGGYSQPR